VFGKGDLISCAVFWPFRALEKEEGIDLISNPMGTEYYKHLNMVSCPRRLTTISASSNTNSCHVFCCWDCVCVWKLFKTGEEMLALHINFYCVGCSRTYFIDYCHILKSHIVLKHAARTVFNFTGLIALQYSVFKLLNTYVAKLNACVKMPEEVCFMYLGN